MCQYPRPVCKYIVSFEYMKKKNLVVIFFTLWKEVVEHICGRGSPLKHLPNRSCSQAGFPPLRCFLWPGCRLKSAARPVVSDRYLQVRAVDEVMVSLSLTEKQGRKFDCGSLNREFFSRVSHSVLFVVFISVAFLALQLQTCFGSFQ